MFKSLYYPITKIFSLFSYSLILTLFVLSSFGTALAASEEATANNKIELQSAADTFVASGHSAESLATFQRVWIGNDEQGGYGKQRAILLFDLSSIPSGSSISSATLRLYLDATTVGDQAMPISVYQMQIGVESPEQFINGLTWSTYEPASVNALLLATTATGTEFDWYNWSLNVANLASSQAGYLALVLQSDESNGQHERGFWSKDCIAVFCDEQPGLRPSLVIEYTDPPTIDISISSFPNHAIEPGDEITYTITYENNHVATLQDVIISNPLPTIENSDFDDLEIVPNSIQSSPNISNTLGNASLTFNIDELSKGEPKQSISYRVRWIHPADKVMPTKLADGLNIEKFAPKTVQAGEIFTYTLVITNTGNAISNTDLKITDSLPEHTAFISINSPDNDSQDDNSQDDNSQDGSFSEQENSVAWTIQSIGQNESRTFEYTVQASEAVTNITLIEDDQYSIIDEEIQPRTKAITVIIPQKRNDAIVNQGATVHWKIDGSENEFTANSGGTRNPPYAIYLPLAEISNVGNSKATISAASVNQSTLEPVTFQPSGVNGLSTRSGGTRPSLKREIFVPVVQR